MSAEAIDRLLGEWEQRLALVDESLLALEGEPTYQMLAPRTQTQAPLTGETRRVVQPALDALRELFEHRGRLTDVLERAREVRASMSGIAFWGNDDKEKHIKELLFGESIELGREMTPLARRGLLDVGARDVRISPEHLLAAMAQAFEGARDAVLAVQRAWESTESSLGSVAAAVVDARQEATSLGVEPGVHDELASIERELAAMRVRVATDPLGTSADVGAGLLPRIEAVSARLGGLSVVRQRVTAALQTAHASLDALRALRQAAVEAVERMPREVQGAAAPGVPTDAGLIDGLGPWLSKIEEAAVAGRWSTADVGLHKWAETAETYRASDARIASALVTVLSRRDELAGRLSARRAQLAALLARGGTLVPGADVAAEEAERLLATRPTPLARAREAVETFERLVRQGGS